MFSNKTSQTYYIGTKVKDKETGKIGIVYKINILRTEGIRIKFNDNTKKAYFGDQLCCLEIVK